MAEKRSLVVKSAVKGLIKNMRVSGDFWKAIDNKVALEIKNAVGRAKANGRKTVRGCDL